MKNESILSLIDDVIEVEEDIIPLLSRYYSKEIEWSGLPKVKENELQNILTILVEDSKKHKRMLADLKKRLKSGGNAS